MNGSIKYLFCQLSRNRHTIHSCRKFSLSSRSCKVKISYAIYPEGSKLGDAQKTPVFVLHGMFGTKANWHSLARRISSDTHRQVVTLDARNHGESEHTAKMNYLLMRDDLLGVMDALKVERPILLGHSMGGKTVMTCALSFPERVESLIVVDTAPKDSPGADTLKVYAEKMKAIPLPESSVSIPEARRILREELKAVVKDEGQRQFLLTNLKQCVDKSYKWSVNLDAIIDNFDDLHSFPSFSSPCTSIRTVFIGGQKSQHCGSAAEPAIYKLFPETSIQLIPNAGHWVHSEKPADFVHLVDKFIQTSDS